MFIYIFNLNYELPLYAVMSKILAIIYFLVFVMFFSVKYSSLENHSEVKGIFQAC